MKKIKKIIEKNDKVNWIHNEKRIADEDRHLNHLLFNKKIEYNNLDQISMQGSEGALMLKEIHQLEGAIIECNKIMDLI